MRTHVSVHDGTGNVFVVETISKLFKRVSSYWFDLVQIGTARRKCLAHNTALARRVWKARPNRAMSKNSYSIERLMDSFSNCQEGSAHGMPDADNQTDLQRTKIWQQSTRPQEAARFPGGAVAHCG